MKDPLLTAMENDGIIQTTDERCGKPSASIVDRLFACKASWKLSKGLPEIVTPQLKKCAEAGDRTHLWLEAPDLIDLSKWPEDLEIGQSCVAIRDRMLSELLDSEPEPKVFKEVRFYAIVLDGKLTPCDRDHFSGPELGISCRTDFAAMQNLKGVVLDYKTGRGEYDDAPRNKQIRTNCLLLWLATGEHMQEIFGGLVQPLAKKKHDSPVRYTAKHLAHAENELVELLSEIEKPGLTPVAGDHCKFCPAKLKCPATLGMIEDVAETDIKSLSAMTPGELSELLRKCDTVEPIIKAAKAHAKSLVKTDPTAVPGWTLEDNSPTRSFTDTLGVFNALVTAKLVDQTTFLRDCVSVGVGDVEKAVRAYTKKTAKEAKQEVNDACAAYIEMKPKEPSLVEVEG